MREDEMSSDLILRTLLWILKNDIEYPSEEKERARWWADFLEGVAELLRETGEGE